MSLSAAMVLGNVAPVYATETVTETVKADAPTITLNIDEDGEVTGIYVQNNDEEYSRVRYGLATTEEIETGEVGYYSSDWLENSETTWGASLESLIRSEVSEIGKYYIVACAENENEARSELTVVEGYPITVTRTSVDEAAVYQIGNVTGYKYFSDQSIDEYNYAKITLSVTDEWNSTWESRNDLSVKRGIFYFDDEYWNENYSAWSISQLLFGKIEATNTGCTVVQSIYTLIEEGDVYTEPRADAPSIELLKEGDVVEGIELRNNDETGCDISFGLATKEEIESGIELNTSYWLRSSYLKGMSFEWIINELEKDFEPGEYYFVSYASNDAEEQSQIVVLEDYPFTITKQLIDETTIYKTGDETGYNFFIEKSKDEYDYAMIIYTYISELYTSISRDMLSTMHDLFYFNYDEMREDWSVSTLFGKIDASNTGCSIEQNIATAIESGGIYEEPQAAAPSLKLHKDDVGNVIGVEITNNITHDEGRIFFGYFWGEEGGAIYTGDSVEAGETKIILFEDFLTPKLEYIEGIEEFVFKCYAVDDNLILSSDYVSLEYPITMEIKEYIGDNITVLVEEDENNTKWYYVDASAIPEGISQFYMNNLSENIFDEEYGDDWGFAKLNDGTKWRASFGEQEIVLESMTYAQVVIEETGMKFVYTQIPQEKMIVENFVSKPVLLLDYDHYNAFVASGGSITINEKDEVEVSTDNFSSDIEWTLEYLYQRFTASGFYRLVKNIADDVKEMANQYWKSDAGSFKVVNYYDTEGNVIAEDSISAHDIVLIEYVPEIVWVDSMELTTPETMKQNETATAAVTLDAGQNKYPFNREPQIRYESSNPEVVAVDAETGALTAGTVDGVATITAYADEALRAEEGLDDIVTASAEIIVGEGTVSDENIASGVIDEEYGQITWVIDNEGKLMVTGIGEIDVQEYENWTEKAIRMPWYPYRRFILSAEIDISGMTDASYFFYGCAELQTIDLSNFDTSNVTDMTAMFYGCYSLTELDVSGFDTSNVIDMTSMFIFCESLQTLDLNNFDTSNVTSMGGMFECCSSLTKLDLSNFNTSNVTNMEDMFAWCSTLVSLDLSSFSIKSDVQIDGIFKESTRLEKIEAPLNCSIEVELPTASDDDKWYLPDGTVITILPQGLTESITILKNQIPEVTPPEEEEPTTPVTEEFSDVQEGKWYVEAVQYVYDEGIMTGNGGLFTPDVAVTRAMVVETLYKMEGKPTVSDFTAYDQCTDLSRSNWWANSVAWAMNLEIATGDTYYKLFNPETAVTREQLATFLYRYAKYKEMDVTLTKDVSEILGDAFVNEYAKEAFAWSVDAGLISGMQGTDAEGNATVDLASQTGATRAQMATILYRFCEKYNI